MTLRKPPNILFLMTDQQRYDTLAAYGNEHLRMPALNRLAGASTVFDRAYCTQPVCTPSRSSVWTGLYPHTNGLTGNGLELDPAIRCLPEWLEGRGHVTAHIGKWHLGKETEAQHGFQHWLSIADGMDDAGRGSHYQQWLQERGYSPRPPHREFDRYFWGCLPERDTHPAYIAERTIEFIDANGDHPWLCVASTLAPHHPLPGPLSGEYDPDSLPVPADFLVRNAAQPLDTRMEQVRYRAGGYEHFDFAREAGWRQAMAHYWGQCALVDRQFGRILGHLERTGRFEDALIVFTSDHGELMGSHDLFGKSYAYDASSRVPMLVKLPGQRERRRVTRPVSLVDLLPTLLDACGETIPPGLQGRSLLGACRGEGLSAADVVIEYHRHPRGRVRPMPDAELERCAGLAGREALRKARGAAYRCLVTPEGWKLTVTDCGEFELFDLNRDPDELDNRAPHADQMLVDSLLQRLRRWQRRTGDRAMELPAVRRHSKAKGSPR